ncbi:uncharacterized protein LOC141714638 [Apium graveolens]|uniref:uncharacterized protein LOC141714638 n=1 Tax=Apium graveolens TaxID=4045 RepID=UPI003D79008D
MSQYFKDSLAICRAIGHPSLFLTMTCNSKWPEIQEMLKLLPNFDPVDAPDIISCVFKLKLDQLLDLIKKKNYFRKCIGVMHVIEFQKRGLPHVHMRIWLSPESRPNSIKKVDQLVSAEIPDKNSDPIAYEAVKNYMMHGPCGKDLYTSPCMVKGKCMRHFPKRFNGNTYFDDCGFPVYRRRNTGTIINKKGINLENQYVVPYNRDLLLRFQCHINLEICNSSRSLKYLFKYCLKGYDTATMLLKKKSNKSGSEQTARSVKNLDEVKNFLDGRYVCASEASWRIFGFDIHHRSPSVERLPIQLPGQKYLNFQSSANLENVCNNATSKKIKLEAWFVANSEFPQAQNFTYSDFPTQFTWIKKTAKWKLRQRCDVVGRLAEVHATTVGGVTRCNGALSFSQLRTIDGTTYDTFKEACGALGLLNNDRQWHDALEENAFSAMSTQIRAMFVNILAYCSVSDPLALWKKDWPTLSDDVLYIRRKISDNIHLTLFEYEIQNYALAEIEKLLNDVGKSLRDFHMMSFPDERFFHTFVNRLIVEETSYNKEELRLNHDKAHKNLNSRQLDIYNALVDNVNKNKGGMFFVYGSGGCEGKIVPPVAGSGIAATLLPGGRTAHSRFKIPLKLEQSSIAGIKHGTYIAELMQHTSIIIWDEAPMQHRYTFEAVDRNLRDIMAAVDVKRGKRPFGGITVVFGAPVIVHSLSSLDIYSRNLRIRVRVTRLWHTNNREGVFVGYNLILLDPRAFVRADIWNSLDNTIVEGQMYEITNFITTHASSILRHVRSALKIVFTPLTTVQTMYPSDLDRIFIARHNFEFVSFPQLAINPESYALDRTFAIDIIGVVADLRPRVNIETIFGTQPLIRFNVTQGPDVSFKVDIWGALTESMTSLYEDGEETPIIIVLSSAKASLLSLILRPPNSTLTPEYRRFLTLGIGLRAWDMMVPIVIDELNKEEIVEGGF